MDRMKYWNGSSWVYKEPKAWTGSAWVQTQAKEWNGSSWITSESVPVGYIDAMDYCHGDGVTDDTVHLTTAADAAKAAGKTLYLPAGVYKVTDWLPPIGTSSGTPLRIMGAGNSSYIKGKVRWRSNQSYSYLMIGSKTTAALGPYYTSGANSHANVTFTYCKFRGGGSYPTLNRPALGDSRSISDRNFVFDHCEWECSYNYSVSATAQDVSWFIDRGSGDRATDIHFNYCHFGTLNEDGKTGGVYGGIVIWSSHTEDYTAYPDMANGYYDDFYFDRCIFEQADVWNLDLSGAQYNPTSFTENTCYITNCAFKGLSGAYRPTLNNGTRICAQEEPGHDCEWQGNLFGIANTNAMKFIKGTSRSLFEDNLFDYRTYRNTIDQQSGTAQIDEIYNIAQVIRIDPDQRDLIIRDNKLLLPTDKYKTISQQGWIYDPSARATKTGNTVKWASGDGPLADIASLKFLPTGWTAPIGSW